MTTETSNARGEWVLVPRSDLLEEDSYGVHGSEFYRCKLCGNESGAGLLNKGIEHSEGCPLAAPQPPAEAQAQGGGEVEQRARELLAQHEQQDKTGGAPVVRRDDALRAIASALSQQPEGMCEKGQAFKDYVHGRLNSMGVPHSVPESEHDKAGCRIGGRLDWVESRMAEARGVVDEAFVARLADELIARHWDVDPDCDGSGIVQLRESVFAALTEARNG